MSFFEELKRRNVFRVAIGYAITAWLLLQFIDLVLENVNAPDWVMQVFMLALAIGFPLAIFFAWAFEMTPDGVKREADIDRSQSITSKTGRKMDRNIIIVLVLALAYFAYDKYAGSEGESPSQIAPPDAESVAKTATATTPKVIETDEKSIAVLPLVNRSVNAEDAFFADGLHDELLTQLSRISALRVISRTSVMGYAGTTKRIPEIAAELGVRTLLEGGVQRSGNRVRINVQLINASNDEHLWAEVYDRELTADNLFDIQSDITQAIANALQAVLTGEEQQTLDQKSTDNVDAYAWYLRGKAAARAYGRQLYEIDETIGFFQSAIELDPQFAAAYAALAIEWMERFWASDRLGDERQFALDALKQAQVLAPELPETLTAEGYYHYWGYLDYELAINAFNRALQHEPGNYLALRGKAYALRRLGQVDESISALRQVISLDPLYAEIHADLAYSLMRTGRHKQAMDMLSRASALDADTQFFKFVQAESYMMLGELDLAWQRISSTAGDRRQGFYDDIQLLVARAQNDRSRIDMTLNDYVNPNAQSLGPIFSRGLVHLQFDELDKLENLIEEFEASLKVTQQEQPGAPSTLRELIQLYGLQKDKAKLAKAVKDYNAAVKPDALRHSEERFAPLAYAIAGDSEALLDFLDDLIEQTGPWEFYYFAIDPSFDSMRDLPRFQAHDQRYREWLKQYQ